MPGLSGNSEVFGDVSGPSLPSQGLQSKSLPCEKSSRPKLGVRRCAQTGWLRHKAHGLIEANEPLSPRVRMKTRVVTRVSLSRNSGSQVHADELFLNLPGDSGESAYDV